MRQTRAIFVDSYRELNSKMMFWISLLISGLVVAIYACIGISEQGFTVLWFTIPSFVNSTILPPETFYKYMFANVGVNLWLGIGAMALALISTASIMPDFVSAGSIELTLSRPMSRIRLFVTKYLAAMLFVVLQVTVFTVAAILVIGIRGGEWLPGLLLTIPLATLIFSFMFSVSVFVGVLTRSTIAAIVAVGVCWFLFFGINAAEAIMLSQRVTNDVNLRQVTKEVEVRQAQIAREQARLDANEEGARSASDIEGLRRTLTRKTDEKEQLEASRPGLVWWHRFTLVLKTPVPKNADTLEVLQFALMKTSAMDGVFQAVDDRNSAEDRGRRRAMGANERLIMKELEEVKRSRGWLYVIGTSLLFEVFMVGLTALIFWRRDF
jgi:ABC-type transport system involved in multi-copper enzyme maturation permease subunit